MAAKKRVFKNLGGRKTKRQYNRKKIRTEPIFEAEIDVNKKHFKFGENRESVIVITILILIFIFSLVYLVNSSSGGSNKSQTSSGSKKSKNVALPLIQTNSSTDSAPISDIPQTINLPKLSNKLADLYYQTPPLPLYFPRRDLFYLNFDEPLTGKSWTVQRQGGGIIPGPGTEGNAFFLDPASSLTIANAGDIAEYGTLNFWILLEPEGFNQEIPLMDWNFDGKNLTPYLFEISYKNNKMIFSVYDANGQRNEIDVLLSDWSSWHHVQFAWDFRSKPSNLEVYINQKKLAQGSFPFVPQTFKNAVFEISGGVGARQVIPFTISKVILTNWVKDDAEMATEK